MPLSEPDNYIKEYEYMKERNMDTWEKLGTLKKGGHWFYQLRNSDTGRVILKPCRNLDKQNKPSKKKRGGSNKPDKNTAQREKPAKKPKNPWAKEIAKARRDLAKSARAMNAPSNAAYNNSRGMRSNGTKL